MAYMMALNMIYFNNQKIKPPSDGLVYTGHYKRVFKKNKKTVLNNKLSQKNLQ